MTLLFSADRYRRRCERLSGRARERVPRRSRSIISPRWRACSSAASTRWWMTCLQKRSPQDAPREGVGGYAAGKAAVANTKMIYQAFKELFGISPFCSVEGEGGPRPTPSLGEHRNKEPGVQRPPVCRDRSSDRTPSIRFPRNLGRNSGSCQSTPHNRNGSQRCASSARRIAGAGIDMEWVMRKLEEDGVASFVKSYEDLSRNLEEKKADLASGTAQGR